MRQSIVEARIAVRHKETSHAYLWWLFFGMFGAHRLYLGRTGSGVAQAILTLTLVGIVVSLPWVLIDLFLIPSMARKYHAQVKAEEYLGFI
jgi:TM2 domain-containing membrane protein YozV